MRKIAQTRIRYGYRRIHALLRREGWQVSRNHVYRPYADEQLQLRSKPTQAPQYGGLAP